MLGAPAALALYVLISVALFGLPIIGRPATAHVGYINDPAMMMWYIAWWPYAIWHGLNPFITHAVWPLTGYNLTWATSMPAVAVAVAPLTVAFGVVVAYNFAALAAPALSGWAAYLLCRRVAANSVGAFAGGLLYGFSPYEAAHVLGGHLVLTINFAPPLCVLLVILLVEGAITCRQMATALALLLFTQCLISTEILATMTLFGVVALLAAIVLMPARRPRMIGAIVPIAWGYAVAGIMLTPFLYYAFVKGSPPKDAIFPASSFSADLLSFVVPGRLIMMSTRGTVALTSRFAGNLWENGSYLSFPLLGVAMLYFWPRRREPVTRLLLLVFLVVIVAELGPVLQVEGRHFMGLPWAGAEVIPLIKHALPVRFANYSFLVLAIMVSTWLSGPRVPFRRVLAVAVLVGLFPDPGFLFRQSSYETPVFFAKGLYRRYLRPGENVLIIPFGRNGASMAWQAETWMYFRMAGGHLSTTPDYFNQWPISNTLQTGLPVPEPAAQFRAFVRAFKIDTIAVADGVKGAASELPALLGVRPVQVGGVSLYHVPRELAADPPHSILAAFQQATASAWFTQLLCAARTFLVSGHQRADLSPAKAHEMGLLPDSKWGETLDQTFAAAPHGAVNGLWIGPGANGTIALGMPASRAALGLLLSHYGADATAVQYPFPRRFSNSDATVPDDSVHYLLMTLRPAALEHCNH
jgi:hypothetical protein